MNFLTFYVVFHFAIGFAFCTRISNSESEGGLADGLRHLWLVIVLFFAWEIVIAHQIIKKYTRY